MFFGFPGQGGDAFVSARLIDHRGNVLEESEDTLCLTSHINDDSVIWLGDHVEIHKLIRWELPPPE